MILHPEARWFGGTIPIFLHWVLATFLLIVGYFHWKYSYQDKFLLPMHKRNDLPQRRRGAKK